MYHKKLNLNPVGYITSSFEFNYISANLEKIMFCMFKLKMLVHVHVVSPNCKTSVVFSYVMIFFTSMCVIVAQFVAASCCE